MMTLAVNVSRYQTLSWNVSVRAQRSRSFKGIANSSCRLDQCVVGIDLAAQPVNEHVDDVRLRIETVIPNVLQDHRLGDNPARIAHQVFEQGELARLELDFLVATPHFAGEQIEREVSHRQT